MAFTTGNGASFALAALSGGATPPASVGRIVSLGSIDGEVVEIEDNDLGSTLQKWCAGDIKKLSALTLGVVFDADVHLDIALSKCGIPYLGTLTFPLPAGQSTPANLAGSGFFQKASSGDFANDARTEGELMWRFDNQDTVLAFTASAA
ncbi:MAG: hypothetical protein AAGF31_07440 [Planctomycetota bacterium]